MTTEAQITRTEHIEIVAGTMYTRVDDPPREPVTDERVRELFEDAQYETRSYSGRCMYGENCLAVYTDSASEAVTVILDVVQACAENGSAEDVLELVAKLRGSRTDSMGRSVVVYWPDISWADCGGDGTDEEEEDHDCEGPHCCTPGASDREDFHSDG
jgi:hypothetical protein